MKITALSLTLVIIGCGGANEPPPPSRYTLLELSAECDAASPCVVDYQPLDAGAYQRSSTQSVVLGDWGDVNASCDAGGTLVSFQCFVAEGSASIAASPREASVVCSYLAATDAVVGAEVSCSP